MPDHDRRIRSFVRREGRLTTAQQRALDQLWQYYGVNFQDQSVNVNQLFDRHAPIHLEIGCGTGDTIIAMARTHPETNFLGLEVHRPGVGNLLQQIEKTRLTNVRIGCVDAVEVLQQLPENTLEAVHIYYPDPWPKKRHHKRRLIQVEFLNKLAESLMPNSRLFIATDWADYAEHVFAVLDQQDTFINLAGHQRCAPRPYWRPVSRYEQRGLRLKHNMFNFILAKTS